MGNSFLYFYSCCNITAIDLPLMNVTKTHLLTRKLGKIYRAIIDADYFTSGN